MGIKMGEKGEEIWFDERWQEVFKGLFGYVTGIQGCLRDR